ncbi:large subunit of alpha-aminoadipate reductase [Cladochytrium tenue]|nr:large subunit of alpha-aminoadipate reductase [Cladochytrium tenue]
MKEEFGMSEKEKFTMLSGIAHDPIQRDIFTPLFLGAQLHIPAAEHIGTPGRLAEWMAEHEVTVTHLTPAMGQLLSANATTPIPSLRNAFFVGDVLTKRDVSRLQFLAQNVHVINMYGTTETQRAVSYLRIPPRSLHPSFLAEQKDIMPAGKGMKDVQLLVCSPKGLQCGVGEVGELYVRSGGLAEGYLMLDDVTKTKFVTNFLGTAPALATATKEIPFYNGPRDRMYRTGDLGRYRPDGAVECTGRADDQVKIRGFRIELGEIDTHLSQHPHVRENVTLVRRDKFEEPTLCSYFVPLEVASDGTVWDGNLSALIKDIREYLKQKLPIYAVPSVFAPLSRMPLTPNGKVDKNALPFPDTALALNNPAVPSGTLTSVQSTIRDVWAECLGIPASSIDLDSNFFDLGGHSILATQLVFSLRKALAVDLPLGTLYKDPTVGGLALEVERINGSDFTVVGGADETVPRPRSLKSSKSVEDLAGDEVDYAAEVDLLDDPATVSAALATATTGNLHDPSVILLTGATGFLGAFVLSELLVRFPRARVICHVRASDAEAGIRRLEDSAKRHLLWNDGGWGGRVSVVLGDLAKERLGLSSETWNELAETVDVIVHNGALVHWVYPFSKLKAPNVLGTVWALRLACAGGRLKALHFVSSTSAIDTRHYIRHFLDAGRGGVPESDDLEGARRGLRSGYGQSKWVAERLVMRARARGVPATIVRPGYVVGHSVTGVGNTDDFIWRLLKGCIQLGKVPRISNIVNMCTVDYVAGCIAEIVANVDFEKDTTVFHMWNNNIFRFDDLFAILSHSGYDVAPTDYIQWRAALMELTLSPATPAADQHALFPLLHFVVDDLPTSTRSPALDDANARAVAVDRSGGRVRCPDMRDVVPLFLGYFVATGFLDRPPHADAAATLPSNPDWTALQGLSSVARTGV